ncbi:MAG: Holliday junction resolvase RuvX [Rhodospirillaceae bacterium]|nr:Holliday junction resolvase RuvX [Rhodospirillaceae bacterium]|tara:strand:- start:537 stop:1031 length:495 start_codon:yes stop_codon:yes gene_type:complete
MNRKGHIADNTKQILSLIPNGKRILGIDLGSKTIGLAVSDTELRIASPVTTLERSKLKNDIIPLTRIIDEYRIGAIVVGLPLNMNGTESPRSQSTRDWTNALLTLIAMPILFWDERLSSLAVERAMLTADLSRKKRTQKIDKAAAAYILQGVLDNIRLSTTSTP